MQLHSCFPYTLSLYSDKTTHNYKRVMYACNTEFTFKYVIFSYGLGAASIKVSNWMINN